MKKLGPVPVRDCSHTGAFPKGPHHKNFIPSRYRPRYPLAPGWNHDAPPAFAPAFLSFWNAGLSLKAQVQIHPHFLNPHAHFSKHTRSLIPFKSLSSKIRRLLQNIDDMQARSNLMWDSTMAENGILKVGRLTDFVIKEEHPYGCSSPFVLRLWGTPIPVGCQTAITPPSWQTLLPGSAR